MLGVVSIVACVALGLFLYVWVGGDFGAIYLGVMLFNAATVAIAMRRG